MSDNLHMGALSEEMMHGADSETMKILIKEIGHRARRRLMGHGDPCPTCFPEVDTTPRWDKEAGRWTG